jgi:hypothetical protein
MHYELYHNKETLELTIKPSKNKLAIGYKEVKPNIFYYNDCFFVSTDRDILKQFANELKNEWLIEVIDRLDKLEKLRVKIKYQK